MKQFLFVGLLVGLSFLEVAVTVLMTKYFGAAQTYAFFAVPAVIGLVVQWFRWRKLKSDAESLPANPFAKYDHLADKERRKAIGLDPNFYVHLQSLRGFAAFWVSMMLLLVPGFVTDIIAFALMFPVVRNRVFDFE